MQLSITRCFLFSLGALLAGGLPAQDFSDTLLLKDGKTPGGGVVSGTVVNEGEALKLTGKGLVSYEPFTLDPRCGTLSVKFRLDFDPTVKDERTKDVLRNQIFVRIVRPDGHYLALYSCLNDVRFGVTRMPGYEILFNTGTLYSIEKGKWVELKLSWGAEFQMEVGGTKLPAQAWDGLFGDLPPADRYTLYLGMSPGYGFENEFSLKDFKVTGGGAGGSEQLAAVPLNREPPPTVDGKLDEPFWEKSTRLDGFCVYGKERLVPERTEAQISYTDAGIYVGAAMAMPGGRAAQGLLTKRDDALYTEDALEVRFLGAEGAIYVFMVNPAGTKYDAKMVARDAGTAYNPEWQAACSQEGGVWTAELFLPYAALGLPGMPAAGQRIKGNISVDVGGFMNSRAWRPAQDYNKAAQMGVFLFTGNSQGLRVKLLDFLTGQPRIDVRKTGPLMPTTTLKAALTDALGKDVSTYSFLMHDGPTATYSGGNLGPGTHRLKLSAVNEDGVPLLQQRLYFDPEVNTRLEVENFPYGGRAHLQASFPPLLQGEAVATVTFALLDAGQATVATAPGVSAGAGSAAADLPTADLAPGAYQVRATLSAAGGKVLDAVLADLRIFPKPVWWKNRIGVDHSVPPPWTPVAALPAGLGVWNRAYLFRGKVFPAQVRNGADDLFTAAPALKLRLGAEVTDLFALAEADRQTFPDEVTVRAAAGPVQVAAKLEFDGCLRVDLEVAPGSTVSELTLDLPVAAKFARFLLSGTDTGAGVTAVSASRDLPFAPYFWLGDYDGGVALFFESDEFFTPNNPKAFQLLKDPSGCLLRVNLVTTPITLAQPLRLTFGLMATPVRENRIKDPFAYSHWPAVTRGLPKLSRPEYLRYGRIAGLPAERGTIEFFFQRDLSAGKADSALFALSLMPYRNETLSARIDNQGNIAMLYNEKELSKGASTVVADQWNHLELSLADGELRLFVNGALVSGLPVPAGVAALWKDLAAGDTVFDLGAYRQYYPDNCDLRVDDVRISRTALHSAAFTVPAGPLERGAETLVLDTLEESFRPDGFTGFTAAGGLPSLGSRFVPGRTGKGLSLVNEPLRDSYEVETKEMRSEVELLWAWHTPNLNLEADWPPYFTFKVDPQLAATIADANARQRLSMVYLLFPAIGEPSELASQFGAEWSIQPRSAMPYAPPEGHKMLMIATGAPGYADYMAYGTKWLMDTYKLKAIYTDGACQPGRTSNAAYGQGWVDPQGNRHPTYPYFATRETIKRIYRVIKESNPDGVLMNHLSFSTPIPVLSFSDILYTGEHEDYTDITTSSFRFNGKPWGLFTFILGASGSHWSAFHTAAGLLNGTAIFGTSLDGRNDMARKTLRVREIYESVDYMRAEFSPWYRTENRLITCADPSVHSAAYVHPGRVALLIVANYSAAAVKATLKLDLDAFGLAGRPFRATNALLETELPHAGDTLEVALLPSNFTLVKLHLD